MPIEELIEELSKKAINAVISGNWEEAIFLNLQILEQAPENVEALNRLGRAYLEVGKIEKAKETFKKTLEVDKFNPIAQKNLKLLQNTQKDSQKTVKIDPNLFLEEPGKTKTVNLVNLADKKILLQLASGEEVRLLPKKRNISVESLDDIYLGRLPDDLSVRLNSLISGGNQYSVYVKQALDDKLTIFIREALRAKKFSDYPSFPSQGESSYLAFTPPDQVYEDAPDVSEEEEAGEEKSESEEN